MSDTKTCAGRGCTTLVPKYAKVPYCYPCAKQEERVRTEDNWSFAYVMVASALFWGGVGVVVLA